MAHHVKPRWPLHFGKAPTLQTAPKFNEKTPRESTKSEILGGRRNKKREILAPHRSGRHPSGPALLGPRAHRLRLSVSFCFAAVCALVAAAFCCGLCCPCSGVVFAVFAALLLLLLLRLLGRRPWTNTPLPLLTIQNVCTAFPVVCAAFAPVAAPFAASFGPPTVEPHPCRFGPSTISRTILQLFRHL